MKKNLGVVQAVYPMPVLMVAAYDENGKVDPSKLQALIFDQFQHGYYVSGEQVGKAWNAGAGLMKK
jgi:hypothetical protein